MATRRAAPGRSIAPAPAAPLRASFGINRDDAELLARVVARRGADGHTVGGKAIRSLDEWILFQLRRDAQALGIVAERRIAARAEVDLGLVDRSGRPRDAAGRFARRSP